MAITLQGAKRTDAGTLAATVTPKLLFLGFLDDGGGDPTIYASPNANTTGVVHGITIVNPDASPHDVFFTNNGVNSEAVLHITIVAGARAQFHGPFIVMPSTTLYAICDTAGVVTATVGGAEHVV